MPPMIGELNMCIDNWQMWGGHQMSRPAGFGAAAWGPLNPGEKTRLPPQNVSCIIFGQVLCGFQKETQVWLVDD